MAVSKTITAPGYWLVKTTSGYSGIVKYASASSPSNLAGAVYLGINSTNINANLNTAIGDLGVEQLWEVPGGVAGLVRDAVSKGFVLYNATPGAITGDPIFTYAAVTLASGGLADILEGAVAGVGAAVTGATDAAGALAEGSSGGGDQPAGNDSSATKDDDPASKGSKGNKDDPTAGKNDDDPAEPDDGSGLSTEGAISALFAFATTPGLWLRILEFVGGAILLYLGLKELTGVDLPTVNVSDAVKAAGAAAVAE